MDIDLIYVECPTCHGVVEIKQTEINCAIFRHGVFKADFTPISPHLPKAQCDELTNNGQIFGCGHPFKLEKVNTNWIAVLCDYI